MKEETLITTENIIKSASLIAGKPVISGKTLAVNNPYNGNLVGTVEMAGLNDTQAAIDIALKGGKVLTRYERYSVLDKTRTMLLERKEEFAQLITAEAGLCITEARYEIGRAHDVLLFASMECLKDDGQVFSCDISPNGKQRKIFTLREPLKLAVAITPFNHPLNQDALYRSTTLT